MSSGQLSAERPMAADLRSILFTHEQLAARIAELGREISRDYDGLNPLLIGVLKGVIVFMADLMRVITIPIEIDYLSIGSFSPATRDKGLVKIVHDLDLPITGRHVIFVEDMIDTGLTLNYLLQSLRARNPASLEVCTLFDKTLRRMIALPIKYRGFELPDLFVVGYGLDFREQYRNLPYVGVLKVDVLRKEMK